MFQDVTSVVLKRDDDLVVPAVLAATLLLGSFAAFSVVVLGYEIVTLFRH